MGIRCSQPQGLPDTANEFLRVNAVKVNLCPHCHRSDGYQREEIDTYGMFEELRLYRYTLDDGRTADEFIQHEVWDCGPMTWLGLRCGDTVFEWDAEDIEQMGG